jgi:hypothetical protein
MRFPDIGRSFKDGSSVILAAAWISRHKDGPGTTFGVSPGRCARQIFFFLLPYRSAAYRIK